MKSFKMSIGLSDGLLKDTVVFGEPFHKSVSELINSAEESEDIDSFLEEELKTSIGDYCIIFNKNAKKYLVTSVGFSGAFFSISKKDFFLSKHLKHAINQQSELAFNEEILLHYLKCKNSRLTSHLVSIFNDINVLGPAQCCAISFNGKLSFDVSSYQKLVDVNSNEEVFNIITDTISKILEKCDDSSLMFSGGIDSLLIGMAIEASGYKPKTFTYWRSASGDNNPLKAKAFANKLNWEHMIVEDEEELPSGKVLEHLRSLMSLDLINPKNPHWGKDPYNSSYTFSGQNADSMSVLNISKRRIYDFDNKIKKMVMPYLLFGKNLLFTDYSLNHPSIVSNIFNTGLFYQKKWRFHADNFIEGLAAYGIPFKNIDYFERSGAIGQLKNSFLDLTKNRSYNNKDLAELYLLHTYMATSLSNIQKNENFQNRKTLLPFNSGPIISYFFNKKRGIYDAWSAKHELSKIVSNRLNESYDKSVLKVQHIQKDKNFKFKNNIEPCDLMKEFNYKRQTNRLNIFSYTKNWSHESLIELENYISMIGNKIDGGKLSNEETSLIYRIVNVELLLE
ncbi:hypothetical protein [Marinifilum fragile]|uniref:hypothetical protein n=1 Tax=Marinifilum fragile TaxID=570161 RepID=UPI002AA898CB|nr:hypothetical protein [Marinifilum fragile]